MTTLPPPTVPFQGWHQMVGALWSYGLRHVDESILHRWIEHACGEMTKDREPESTHLLRPSGHIDCLMKTYLISQGFKPQEDDKTNMAQTFNTGHLLHAHAFAFIETVLPPGFAVTFEHKVDLGVLPWWPRDPEVARQSGSADLVIAWTDEEVAAKYFAEVPAQICLVDFKSAADHIHKAALQGNPQDKADPFGSLSQLAVYQGALGLEGEAVLAFINRNLLKGAESGAPLAAKPISPQVLEAELERVRERVERPAPVPEKLHRWGKQINWFCRGGAKAPWCDFAAACSEFRHPESVDV